MNEKAGFLLRESRLLIHAILFGHDAADAVTGGISRVTRASLLA